MRTKKKFLLYTHIHWVKYTWESVNDSLYMEWDIRRCYYTDPFEPPSKNATVFYTDSELSHAAKHNCAKKIALIMESQYIAPHTLRYLEENIENFDLVLTHNRDFISKFPEKSIFYPHCNCLIKRQDFQIYEKSKLVSFISSTKQMDVSGHMMRHAIYKLYMERHENWVSLLSNDKAMDCYGSLADNFVAYKLDSVKDYCFQVVVENSIIDTYFTEKIIDCFVTGTIPIYYGTAQIVDYFDPRGIIQFSTLEELFTILGGLSEAEYLERMSAVEENFKRAQKFVVAEDWIYQNTNAFD